MNRILILTEQENDLAALILKHCENAAVYSVYDDGIPFESYDAVCVLGGTEERYVIIPAHNRRKIEKVIQAGKPVFCEYVGSIGCICSRDNPVVTTHHRMVYSDAFADFAGLHRGDILDGHYNDLLLYYYVPSSAKPILTYHDFLCAHDHIEMDQEAFLKGNLALWYLNDCTLVSSFRLCNFNRARLAPRDNWQKIIKGIVDFLAGEDIPFVFPKPVYKTYHGKCVTCAADTQEAVQRGLLWFENAKILRDNGKKGVTEGFCHFVSARTGKQLPFSVDRIRADCAGETGGAFLLDYLRTKNRRSFEIFMNTAAFCFDEMQVKDGPHRGMVRWTEGAWEVCYQDDVARAILGTLLCQNFGEKTAYFDDAVNALRYLVDTTGVNGLRVSRTECFNLTQQRKQELKTGKGSPCAHYNAYYYAALLLAARADAGKEFADIAVKGLSSIMAVYPDTVRETSETEEMCRLVFPLALLYEYSGEKQHYEWLHRVVKDLERVQHPCGGYAEWDTGYKANCSRNHGGECALLANNGDPVADLLYSNNWLPLGFAYAYMVTREEYFHKKWEEIAAFLLCCQICSDDTSIDGAWARAVDMDRMEIYGVPHDIGWAPCCIESGWTVGEILMGLQFMAIAEKYVDETK